MNTFIKALLRPVARRLPWWSLDVVQYVLMFRRPLRINRPRYLNDWVMRRKWKECRGNALFSLLADKFAVRRYVSELLPEDVLIPLLHKFDNVIELRAALPSLSWVVVKPNHGAGMVRVLDLPLNELEQDALILEASAWLELDYSVKVREAHYSGIKPCLLVEERIGERGVPLDDYKIHIFKKPSGEARFVLQIIEGRFSSELVRTFYVDQFDRPSFGSYALSLEKKAVLERAVEFSSVLLGTLRYARVDWYIVGDRLYFGEITITPASGLGGGYGEEIDRIMGVMFADSITN